VFRLIRHDQIVNLEPLTWRGFVLFSSRQVLALIAALILIGSHSNSIAQGNKPPTFEADVLPVLKAKCIACHSGEKPQAQLDLQTKPSIIAGGKAGGAIVVGSSEKSLLVEKVLSASMPPVGEKLTAAEIALIRLWIDKGAPAESQSQQLASTHSPSGITENEVTPILQMRCIVCHGKRRQEGGLDLRTQASRLKGGKSGPALVAGKPEESLLMKRILSGEMPPSKMLFDFAVRPPTSAEVDVVRKWIAAGAPPAPKQAVLAEDAVDPLVSDDDRKFWSFQSPKRPQLPAVRHQELVLRPIDAFLLHKLEAKNLSFSPPAERLTLMRRAYLDLTGLPPYPAEVESYLKDERSDSYERLVDRLLESPHYGERWGQFWLNAAGYSDSEGIIDADHRRVHAWRYRDYVIRSFNNDKPYDQFLTEQIAGDELVDYKHVKEVTPALIDKLAATGFLRMAPDGTYSPANSSIPERMNVIADEIEVLGSSILGLTVGCARCHNHKYDPIPQRDYYRLGAILQTAYDPYDWLIPTADNPANLKYSSRHLDIALASERQATAEFNAPIEAEIKRLEASLEARSKPLRDRLLEERLAALPSSVRDDLRGVVATPEEKRSELQKYLAEKFQDTLKITPEELGKHFEDFKPEFEKSQKAIAEQKGKLRPKPLIRALFDMGGEPSVAYLLRRGDAQTPGEPVRPGVPSVIRTGLAPYKITAPTANLESSGRRLALARWLVQPNHPLTARVMVNRIWMNHFGRGLVASPANFGRNGLSPSHPELLDWLATEFVRSGWSMKAMHRLIMTSAAYRQSSEVGTSLHQADPDNLLLSRMPMRRMEAEVLYDSILKVTGSLDPTLFGPPVEVEFKPEGEVVAKGTKAGWRRSIYVLQRRRTPMTMLEVFDQPPMSPNCIERRQSTVPTQALQMMNSDVVHERSRYFAGRLVDQFRNDREKQIQALYVRALSRPPTGQEIKLATSEIDALTEQWMAHLENEKSDAPIKSTAEWKALSNFCQTMLSSAEFLYID
jgi:mono/diheme cytochrome c family protein